MNSKTSIPLESTTTLDFVKGDLTVGEHSIIKGTGKPPTVKVSGTIYCEGDNTFEGNILAENLEAQDNVTIHGDLQVENNVEVEGGRLEVYGDMTARHIDVDESLYVNKDLTVGEIGRAHV